jgi:hypothetical protein
MAREAKTAKESPYKFTAELLLEEKLTYEQIHEKVVARFPDANFPRARIGTVLANLNAGKWGGIAKPSHKIKRVLPVKPDKPAKKDKPAKPAKPAAKAKAPAKKESKPAAKPAAKSFKKPAPAPKAPETAAPEAAK